MFRVEYRTGHTRARRLGMAALLIAAVPGLVVGQSVSIGAGSYTTALPGGATAPQATVYKTFGGPVPTHKFWTSKYWVPLSGGATMFPHPLSMQVAAGGLSLGFFNGVNNNGTWFNQPYEGDLTVGTAGLNAASANVSATYDWAVDINWGGAITARVGRGMPFAYFFTNGQNPVITFAGQPTVFANNGNLLGVSIANNNYGLFCPAGGTWGGIGSTTLTCQLPAGHNYFSLALLPSQAALSTYAQYAFSFPTDTRVSWSYDPSTSRVTTSFNVTTRAMEGTQTGFLMALYPHQYSALQGSINTSYTYASPRGTMMVLNGTSFSTVDTYHGVLPFLPPTGNYNVSALQSYIDTVANEADHYTAGDTYGAGKQLNRVAQLLPLARVANDTTALNGLQTSLTHELQDWFTATPGETFHLFYFNPTWGSLIGYPAGFGSDTTLADHHFHYGYFIHSAALLGLLNPSWLAPTSWGGMVDLLRQDIANTDRTNTSFPFLRYFDPYAGHSWASGNAPFGDGGNEESSSEAVNAWAGLILYGAAAGNTAVRDEGIWLYTQETKTATDYWFNDGPVATFPIGFQRVAVANVFDGKSDTGTWFGGQIEFEHGIEFLPYTGGSLYLGADPAYVQKNWNEIVNLEGGSFNPATANWPDLMEEYLAFIDPTTALNRWTATTQVFDGESRAHEYYWISELQALGRVDESTTANTPLYAVFRNPQTGRATHVAYNPNGATLPVTFSDGASFSVPAGSMISEYGTFSLSSGVSGSGGGGSGGGGGTPGSFFINAGGGASGMWEADMDFAGGNTASTSNVINTSLIPAPVPPQSVYQTERYGPMTYTVTGLTAGRSYTVQLHFAEFYWTSAGQRRFNVLINGTQVLTEFDIIANTGAPNVALEENFSAQADASGRITVQLTNGSADLAKISGLAIF